MRNFGDIFRGGGPGPDLNILPDRELLALEEQLKTEARHQLKLWERIAKPSEEDLAKFLKPKEIEAHAKGVEAERVRLAETRKKLANVQNIIWERGLKSGQYFFRKERRKNLHHFTPVPNTPPAKGF